MDLEESSGTNLLWMTTSGFRPFASLLLTTPPWPEVSLPQSGKRISLEPSLQTNGYMVAWWYTIFYHKLVTQKKDHVCCLLLFVAFFLVGWRELGIFLSGKICLRIDIILFNYWENKINKPSQVHVPSNRGHCLNERNWTDAKILVITNYHQIFTVMDRLLFLIAYSWTHLSNGICKNPYCLCIYLHYWQGLHLACCLYTFHKKFEGPAVVQRGIPVTHLILSAQGAVWWTDISHKFSLASPTANGCLSAASLAQTGKALPLRRKERA